MMRNIYFEGELGDKFTPHFQMDCNKVADIFKCIDANFSDFKSYMIQKHEEGIGYHIEVAGNDLEDPAELLLEIKEGDIIVTPIPAGSKSGPAKILAAIALVVVTGGAAAVYAAGGMTALGGGLGAVHGGLALALSGGLGAMAQTLTLMSLGMATNLAIAGISQTMAPDPSTDADQEQSYLFNGAEQNIVEGDPVPVLYGRLRVPGQPISFEIAGAPGSRLGSNGIGVPINPGGPGGNPGYTGPMPEVPVPEVPKLTHPPGVVNNDI